MKTLSTLLVAWGLAACAAAAETKDAVATFLDGRSAAVARVRLDAADALGGAEPLTTAYRPWLDALQKAGARELYVVATLDTKLSTRYSTPSSPPFALVPLEEGADAKAIGELLCGGEERGGPAFWTTCASIRGAVLAGDDATLERAKAMKPSPRPDLAEAFAAAGDAPIALAAATPEDLRRAIDEQVAALPEELGGGPPALVTRGLKWASVACRPGAPAPIRLLVQTAGADEAAKLMVVGGKGVELMRGSAAVAAFVPGFATMADALAPKVEGDRIVVELSEKDAVAWVRAAVDPVLESRDRRECLRNLMNIGLAMHNYHSRHDAFPPAYTTDARGKPLLSWRVLILPYLEANDLYKEFHLDEPWDSPHNKALIPRMPKYFACPSTRRAALPPGTTIYQRPVGPAIGVDPTEGMTIKGIVDGAANTVMVLEVPIDQAVEWTRPADFDAPATVDPKAFLTRHLGGAQSVFMDGSGRFLRDSMKPETLRFLMTPTGGEVVPAKDY